MMVVVMVVMTHGGSVVDIVPIMHGGGTGDVNENGGGDVTIIAIC